MSDDNTKLVPASSHAETALDIAAFVASALPWIGGPVSNVLSGMSLGRKFARVREVLEGIATDLAEFKSEVSEKYVKTDEFEELLEKTLRQAAEERNEEKRKVYRAFLTDAIKLPGKPYDEQIRILRTLEELQPYHVRVLKAMSQEPDPNRDMSGSPIQTLLRRVPGIAERQLEEIVGQLNDMRVTKLTRLNVMMTARGAADLRHAITDYGRRVLTYIVEA